MLVIENLTSGYGRVDAIHQMSLSVREGEVVALLGPNGAGKTTLLRAISNLIVTRVGAKSFNGTDITRYPAHRIVDLGIIHVPEGRRILAPMTVYENLLLGAHVKRRELGREGMAKSLREVYSLFPILEERKSQLGGTLSGGEQQMLAIGRGMMARPKLLMLDEPTLGLAPIMVEEIVRGVSDLKKRGVSILLVEENASVAMRLADRVYVVDLGKIILESTPGQLEGQDVVRNIYLGTEQA